jgi:acyl-CoA synthetase (AMP-forming)/AMP-acid ligase II
MVQPSPHSPLVAAAAAPTGALVQQPPPHVPSQVVSVTAMLRRNAKLFASSTATVDIAAKRSQSWGELKSRVAKLAHAFTHALGLKRGDRVALLGLNSDAYFEAMFAAPWAGLIVVPCNFRLTPEELQHVLADSGAALLCVDETFAKQLWPQLKDRMSGSAMPRVALLGDGDVAQVLPGAPSIAELIRGASSEAADDGRGGDDIWGIVYTGGTTGKAKGVCLTHGNVMCNALGTMGANNFNLQTRYLHVAPMFHLADAQCVFAGSLGGSCHVFAQRFAPPELLPLMAAHRVNKLVLIPVMIQMVLALPNVQELGAALKDVEIEWMYGGSPMAQATMQQLLGLFPKSKLFQGFGMTETSPAVAFLDNEGHAGGAKLGTIGRPVPWAEVKIVDAQGNEVAGGQSGEILVRGANVMLGYWNLPEQTALALKHGWMHTGDGGYLDADGYLVLSDRIKDMIKTGGENVFSAEVERVLGGIAQAQMNVVIGVPDDKFGELVVAVFVPKVAGTVITLDQVKEFCAQQGLAGYKTPKKVIMMDKFPMSGAGKILKHQVKKELGGVGQKAAGQTSTYA